MSRTHDRSRALEHLVLEHLQAFRSHLFTVRMLESNLGFPGRCRLKAVLRRLARTGQILTEVHHHTGYRKPTLYFKAHPMRVNTLPFTGFHAATQVIGKAMRKAINGLLDLQRAIARAHLLRTSERVDGWLDCTYPEA